MQSVMQAKAKAGHHNAGDVEVNTLRYCSQPVRLPREFPADMPAGRANAIIGNDTKWLNGTVLHYYFFDSEVDHSTPAWTAADAQRDIVRKAFSMWKALGVGLEFTEVDAVAEAEVRIGFDQQDGSWSYVGTDILPQPVTERTMNFGWSLTATPYGLTTALHEIGHTLGMPHEHQNPFAGIEWNEEAVYSFLGGPPNNWPRTTTFNNVLRKIAATEVVGSSWDPNSIMEYSFPAGLINAPVAYQAGIEPPGDLSPLDKQYMVQWYPGTGTGDLPTLDAYTSAPTTLAPGQQVDYQLDPPGTRSYTIATFGNSDVVLGLFEEVDGELRYVSADNNSGQDRNALIKHKLFKGRKYVVRVRCFYALQAAVTTVMYY